MNAVIAVAIMMVPIFGLCYALGRRTGRNSGMFSGCHPKVPIKPLILSNASRKHC